MTYGPEILLLAGFAFALVAAWWPEHDDRADLRLSQARAALALGHAERERR